jgi:hypothetical protein
LGMSLTVWCRGVSTSWHRVVSVGVQDTFGKSDPFLRFSRVNEDGGSLPVFKTEVVKDNLNPTWRTIVTTMQRLCNGDPYRPVLVECFDWDADGSHELIGSVQTSLDDIMQRAASGARLSLVNATRRQKVGAGYLNSGQLRIVQATVTPQPSFLDYIVGGCELNFLVSRAERRSLRPVGWSVLSSGVVCLCGVLRVVCRTLCAVCVVGLCACVCLQPVSRVMSFFPFLLPTSVAALYPAPLTHRHPCPSLACAGRRRLHRLKRQPNGPQLAAPPRPARTPKSVPARDPGCRWCPRVLRRRQAVPCDGLRRLPGAGHAREPLLPHD